jgi:hypothetical protein
MRWSLGRHPEPRCVKNVILCDRIEKMPASVLKVKMSKMLVTSSVGRRCDVMMMQLMKLPLFSLWMALATYEVAIKVFSWVKVCAVL